MASNAIFRKIAYFGRNPFPVFLPKCLLAILMVSHDLRNAVEEANKILHLQKRVLFYGPAHDYMNSQAAGHFFHEKEQGRCKPTAGCHTVKLHMHKEEKS